MLKKTSYIDEDGKLVVDTHAREIWEEDNNWDS